MDYTLIELVRRSTEYLEQRGIDTARREVEWIFADRLGLSRLELYTNYNMLLETHEVTALREDMVQRGKRLPLAYILGHQPFRSLSLKVNSSVLVPRPETEELIDLILAEPAANQSGARLLDVGTGSGAIALACKSERPTLQVTALDISTEALAVAKANADQLSLEIEWVIGDLTSGYNEPVDIVVANLPYIAESERDLCDPELHFEPQVALFAENDGLALMFSLMADLKRLWTDRPHACCWLEHGFAQAEAIQTEAQRQNLQARTVKDSGGHDRFTRLSSSC